MDLNEDVFYELTHTSGAILMGGQIALYLSGAVLMQVIVYFQMYPSDSPRIRAMASVYVIWFLDILHSTMIFIINWENLVVGFGNPDTFSRAIWPLTISIGLTAVTTFFVHGFFSYRIHTLSRGKWYITGTLVTLSIVRVVSAIVSCGGLTDRIVDLLTLYTVETGMLTCIVTTASLICWAAMPTTLIFLSLLLSLGKLYANTFLASLNARRSLSDRTQTVSTAPEGHSMSILWPTPPRSQNQVKPWVPRTRGAVPPKPMEVTIDIEHTIHREDYRRGVHAVGRERSNSSLGLDSRVLEDAKD
ncbi:uncharacterized protein TRAVEDRAFT_42607 [Trametes versicolor FP-101664 SS1]|uniref:uncharacterized protein n=1 Tax=Trametes versicolor (strain FP-101664) TaxID=717944 RepID=UPI0004624041|nr:uncharacterized protein TRAVEDRAFT_42607 [Trametes versicolor FP-101664 SS1]EIW65228.1 hypothetical protein TRAVEDRAFT_42607 [Trametes versicolor FP-101664 SS1]